jgi:DinB superfamily
MDIISKAHIVSGLQMANDELKGYCNTINSGNFFFQPADKWSIAQNITHLFAADRITHLVFRLPKFIVRLYGGKPNRPSRSYDELVAKYTLKLQQGGRASGIFIPKLVPASLGQEKIITAFSSKMHQLINTIEKKWHDHELDNYIIPHPLLGKITLRELCYFTIYHTYHHLRIIKECCQ